MENVKFEVLSEETVQINERNFIEVAKKKAVSENTSYEFYSISRGFLDAKGQKKFKNSVSIPCELIEKVILAMDRIKTL